MKLLERLQLLLAALAILAPAAHVLELPNKLALDGALWLAVQQHLYRGWGPFFGGPVEIGALVTSLWLAVRCSDSRIARSAFAVAAAAYVGMILGFFVFNAPVNNAVSTLTPATLPPSWPALRAKWETGHAIAAVLAIVAIAASLKAWLQRHLDIRVPRAMDVHSLQAGGR
jgi:hypothetical protein